VHALSLVAEGRIKSVLAIGAHADDVEIGCGGTLLTLGETHPEAELVWVVLSARGERADEARRSAAEFVAGFASADIVVESFPDGYFPYSGGDVKERFEKLKREVSPDLIFTHQREDLHQDHRVVCELTWNTFRNHLIFEYEVPKYDGDFGAPNVFVELSDRIAERKVDLLFQHFASQRDKHWFTEDLFHALMRLRAMEANSASKRVEAFYCRKLVFGWDSDDRS
jgi:LmbE family N-acetylglucosaminyl deacetylase